MVSYINRLQVSPPGSRTEDNNIHCAQMAAPAVTMTYSTLSSRDRGQMVHTYKRVVKGSGCLTIKG